MKNGVLFAVPIPEEHEAVGQDIQKIVDQAVRESEENGISASGNDSTPWLLSRIAELSKGKSLASNIALLENTALVGEVSSSLIRDSSFDFPFRWSNRCRVPEVSRRNCESVPV